MFQLGGGGCFSDGWGLIFKWGVPHGKASVLVGGWGFQKNRKVEEAPPMPSQYFRENVLSYINKILYSPMKHQVRAAINTLKQCP